MKIKIITILIVFLLISTICVSAKKSKKLNRGSVVDDVKVSDKLKVRKHNGIVHSQSPVAVKVDDNQSLLQDIQPLKEEAKSQAQQNIKNANDEVQNAKNAQNVEFTYGLEEIKEFWRQEQSRWLDTLQHLNKQLLKQDSNSDGYYRQINKLMEDWNSGEEVNRIALNYIESAWNLQVMLQSIRSLNKLIEVTQLEQYPEMRQRIENFFVNRLQNGMVGLGPDAEVLLDSILPNISPAFANEDNQKAIANLLNQKASA
ncbi:hypothetical protein DLAC_07578 [Tieghemostelium lacteum]|uniref:Uncharacterized protein n=1 Tax=Tieghemostelium lacteum TaxID=361077 RepID=A0A151ZCV7_TIELA|nr:hypothetical protein DLAC_07578 [Tieghemostelium lacteum]|eukprot:KYQ91783.1 hypothetical protein DLAC_07578 [Tieghemostelium lacteum]